MKKIVGVFRSQDKAVRALEGLRSSGFRDEEISIITKDEENYNKLTNRVGADKSDATAGAVTGGTIGGLGGLLLGLGAFAIPGVGPIIAAGPIAAALTGAFAGGATGGLAGGLIDYGVPETDATEYEELINAGDILILVDDDDEARRDKVYDNFYENDSLNRSTYRHSNKGVKDSDSGFPMNSSPDKGKNEGIKDSDSGFPMNSSPDKGKNEGIKDSDSGFPMNSSPDKGSAEGLKDSDSDFPMNRDSNRKDPKD